MMKKVVIWPAYLTASRARGEGRIISRKNAVKAPKLDEIEKVAKTLNWSR